MTINIKLWFGIFVAMEAALIALCFYLGKVWLINTQAGLLGSFLVVIGSFLGYRKMVAAAEDFVDEPDIIEKIEDPHGVWDDDDKPSKISSVKTAAKNVKTTARGFLSPYRIISYMLFCVIFLILVKNSVFAFIPFAVGVSFVPLWVFICGIFSGIAGVRSRK